MALKPVVVDIYHGDEVEDFKQVRKAGVLGVIHKATEGVATVDKSYTQRRADALSAGLLWGAYHFGTNGDVATQVQNFLNTAKPDGKTLLVLDWEPYKSKTMSLGQAKDFLKQVYDKTGQRPALYSGNQVKEQCPNGDDFLSLHRLWLCQYSTKPKIPKGWDNYWLWQYTGDGVGPAPHAIDGISTNGIDLNVFGGSSLAAEWVAQTAVASVATPAPKPVILDEPKPMHEAASGSKSVGLGLSAIVMMIWGHIMNGLDTVLNFIVGIFGGPDTVGDISPLLSQGQQLSGYLNLPWKEISGWLVVILIGIMIYRHVRDVRWLDKGNSP